MRLAVWKLCSSDSEAETLEVYDPISGHFSDSLPLEHQCVCVTVTCLGIDERRIWRYHGYGRKLKFQFATAIFNRIWLQLSLETE